MGARTEIIDQPLDGVDLMQISNIAAAINAAHAGVEGAKREGTKHAIECGRLLVDAKATVGHGRWNDWIRHNCSFSDRTAQLYIQLFRDTEANPANPQRVADLSLRDAAQAVGRPRNWARASRRSAEPELTDDRATASQVLVFLIVKFGGLPGLMKLMHAFDVGCTPKSIGRAIRLHVEQSPFHKTEDWEMTLDQVFDQADIKEVKTIIYDAWGVGA